MPVSSYKGQIHRLYLADLPDEGTTHALAEENFHIAKVLRFSPGDPFFLIDGKGGLCHAVIADAGKKQITFTAERIEKIPAPASRVTLIQGVPKMDRAEWIIQKCTELGVSQIQFVQTEHSVAVKKDSVLQRWNKIAMEACRQSGQLFFPEITLNARLQSVLEGCAGASLPILCNEFEKNTSLTQLLMHEKFQKNAWIVLAIGPEGGWSQNELQEFHDKSYKSVYLAKNILRVETASIVSLAIARSFMLE